MYQRAWLTQRFWAVWFLAVSMHPTKGIAHTQEVLKMCNLYKGMFGRLSKMIDASFLDEKLPIFLFGSFALIFLSRGRSALVLIL